MGLVSLLIALIIIGAVLYIVNLLPLDATIKKIIQVVAVVLLVVWLIRDLAPSVLH